MTEEEYKQEAIRLKEKLDNDIEELKKDFNAKERKLRFSYIKQFQNANVGYIIEDMNKKIMLVESVGYNWYGAVYTGVLMNKDLTPKKISKTHTINNSEVLKIHYKPETLCQDQES